jgi:hypothetical protein
MVKFFKILSANQLFMNPRFAKCAWRIAKFWFKEKISDEAIHPKPMNQETVKRTGGPRPSGRKILAERKMENSGNETISIVVTGVTTGVMAATVSTFPCATMTTAQSSLSGIAPPCIHACKAGYASATVINSQSASDNPAVAACRRSRH